MDWPIVAQNGVIAASSGVSAFLGAYLRFKLRLKECEDSLKKLVEEVQKLRDQCSALAGGWRLELDSIKEDVERERKHKQEIEYVLDKERASRPDPYEIVQQDLTFLKRGLEKLKERQGEYVKNEEFVSFVRLQEVQWKEIARTLGRLEATVEQ